MSLKDEMLLVAMLAFVIHLFFVVIIDRYSSVKSHRAGWLVVSGNFNLLEPLSLT